MPKSRGRAWSRRRSRSKIHYRSKSPYGKRTRGWKKSEPIRGVERHFMHQRCGRHCFLLPSQEKFPICTHGTCKRNCKGILSAKVRAKQYGYPAVAKRADAIGKRTKCKWAMS